MRTYVKQKRYQEHIRAQVITGRTNNASGGWVEGDGGNKTSAAHGFAGAKGNKSEKDRRPYKGGKIHWTKKV